MESSEPEYEIDGIPECSTPERDERGMWRTIHKPSGRVIESYTWERLVHKAMIARIRHTWDRA